MLQKPIVKKRIKKQYLDTYGLNYFRPTATDYVTKEVEWHKHELINKYKSVTSGKTCI